MRRIFIFFILSFFVFTSKSQSTINGKVFEVSDKGEEIPVFSANVYWKNSTVGTTTDKDGFFKLKKISDKISGLEISFVGYEIVNTQVINDSLFVLMQNSVDLEDVDIKAKSIGSIVNISNKLYKYSDYHYWGNTKYNNCNLSECFETNNSIDVSYSDAVSGIKTISMLGLDGNYIQITSELLPLVRGLQRSYGLKYVPGTWIENIQIIKGVGSVVNGFESLTGQINVEYFKPDESTDRIKIKFIYNFIWKI